MKPERQRTLLIAVTLAAIIAVVTTRTPQARSDDSHEKKVKDAAAQSAAAAKAFEAIMQVPDKAIPRDVLARAKAIAVFPRVLKVAFAVGGGGGRGVVSRHTAAAWGRPVFLRAGGGSVGPQIGASSTDFVLLFMKDEGVEQLMKDKLEVGAEIRATAGPVGPEAGVASDVLLQAELLTYTRSRGLFAGANLKGVVVRPEDDLNMAVYDKTARELLSDQASGDAGADGGLKAFPQAIGRYTVNPSGDR
jgi:lipid-binding SYLF domain-containing protein